MQNHSDNQVQKFNRKSAQLDPKQLNHEDLQSENMAHKQLDSEQGTKHAAPLTQNNNIPHEKLTPEAQIKQHNDFANRLPVLSSNMPVLPSIPANQTRSTKSPPPLPSTPAPPSYDKLKFNEEALNQTLSQDKSISKENSDLIKKVFNTPINNEYNIDPENITLVQTMLSSDIMNENNSEKIGIVSPQTLLIVYKKIMNTDDLMKSILSCLKNDKLPLAQKNTILEFCNSWLKSGTYIDDLQNQKTLNLLEEIKKNAKTLGNSDNFEISLNFSKSIIKAQDAAKATSINAEKTENSENLSKLIENIKKNGGSKNDVIAISEELTSIQAEFLASADVSEFFTKGIGTSSGKEIDKSAPNLQGSIKFVNNINNWMGSIILNTADSRKRSNLYEFFIKVAEECYKKGDFFTFTTIVGNLNSVNISKSVDAKRGGKISEKINKKLEDFTNISSPISNFKNLNAEMNLRKGPIIRPLLIASGQLDKVSQGEKKVNLPIRENWPNISNLNMLKKVINPFLNKKEELVTQFKKENKFNLKNELTKYENITEKQMDAWFDIINKAKK